MKAPGKLYSLDFVAAKSRNQLVMIFITGVYRLYLRSDINLLEMHVVFILCVNILAERLASSASRYKL